MKFYMGCWEGWGTWSLERFPWYHIAFLSLVSWSRAGSHRIGESTNLQALFKHCLTMAALIRYKDIWVSAPFNETFVLLNLVVFFCRHSTCEKQIAKSIYNGPKSCVQLIEILSSSSINHWLVQVCFMKLWTMNCILTSVIAVFGRSKFFLFSNVCWLLWSRLNLS